MSMISQIIALPFKLVGFIVTSIFKALGFAGRSAGRGMAGALSFPAMIAKNIFSALIVLVVFGGGLWWVMGATPILSSAKTVTGWPLITLNEAIHRIPGFSDVNIPEKTIQLPTSTPTIDFLLPAPTIDVTPSLPGVGSGTVTSAPSGDAGSAVSRAGVAVGEPQDIAGYNRTESFGAAWSDASTAQLSRNGCDTRNDILQRDLVNVQFKQGSRCVVQSGTLNDTYTGKAIQFVRGATTSSAVQIDHKIPLKYAWEHGASTWSPAQRLKFANDPLNLIAADGPSNSAKSDRGPGEWMPSNKADHCRYAQDFMTVASTYSLTVSTADAVALNTAISTCR